MRSIGLKKQPLVSCARSRAPQAQAPAAQDAPLKPAPGPVAEAPRPKPATPLCDRVRAHFPILDQKVHDKPLVYLDSAATSQKPTAVLDAVRAYYDNDNANVHRGVHALASRATDGYEGARAKVARLINAKSDREVVWTRNATEAINLIANSWGRQNLGPGDEVVVSVAEHHANIVPWQMVCQATGATLKHVRLNAAQEIDIDDLAEKVTPKTKLVAMVHVSNTLASVLPVHQVAEIAKAAGARLLLDCCQSVPHMPVDVQTLGADWIVASGHKMCAPTGVGFLWAPLPLLESMPPWIGGGEMIQDVFLDHSTFSPPPTRFEAGTPAIGEVIGLGAAVDYIESVGGMDALHAHETELGGYLYQELARVEGVTIYGPEPGCEGGRAGLAAFNVEGLHATDVSMLLDASGVAVRSGHHCTQPLHRELSIAASARASLYLYNNTADVDAFIDALVESAAFFKEMHS